MNRKGFVHKLASLLDSKNVQPQKRTSMSYLEIKHTHTHTGFFSAGRLCLTLEKFVMPENMYLCLWAKAKCYRETKIPYLLSLGKWIIEGCASRKIIKRPNWFCRMSSRFGLWNESQGPLFLTLGRHLSSLTPLYSSIWKSRIIPAAYLTLRDMWG